MSFTGREKIEWMTEQKSTHASTHAQYHHFKIATYSFEVSTRHINTRSTLNILCKKCLIYENGKIFEIYWIKCSNCASFFSKQSFAMTKVHHFITCFRCKWHQTYAIAALFLLIIICFYPRWNTHARLHECPLHLFANITPKCIHSVFLIQDPYHLNGNGCCFSWTVFVVSDFDVQCTS